MNEAIELTDIVLRVIGAFYAFAGFVATRAAMMSRLRWNDGAHGVEIVDYH